MGLAEAGQQRRKNNEYMNDTMRIIQCGAKEWVEDTRRGGVGER